MTETQLKVYGVRWCFDCHRTRRFLDSNQVYYEWIDIDNDQSAEETVIRLNRGNRSVPTLVFPDATVLVEPSNQALAKKLGLK